MTRGQYPMSDNLHILFPFIVRKIGMKWNSDRNKGRLDIAGIDPVFIEMKAYHRSVNH